MTLPLDIAICKYEGDYWDSTISILAYASPVLIKIVRVHLLPNPLINK